MLDLLWEDCKRAFEFTSYGVDRLSGESETDSNHRDLDIHTREDAYAKSHLCRISIPGDPKLENVYAGSTTYASGDRIRLTGDINQELPIDAAAGSFLDGSAFRLNGLYQYGGVPGRDSIERNSWAIAPSLAFGIDTPTRLVLQYQHVEQDNIRFGTEHDRYCRLYRIGFHQPKIFVKDHLERLTHAKFIINNQQKR